MSSDPHQLQRFVDAQAPVWDDVKAELLAGKKRTHWMWFVFPQLGSLGRSATARLYGIAGLEEARSYLKHPVLGPRLIECCDLLTKTRIGSAAEVFGVVDAMKFRSCLTLFHTVAPETPAFAECLLTYFDGHGDPLTTELLAR